MVKSFSIACQELSGENSTAKSRHHVITLTPSFPGRWALISELWPSTIPPKVSRHCTVNSSKHERRSGDDHEMWHEIREGRDEKIYSPKNVLGLPSTTVSQGSEDQEEKKVSLIFNSIVYNSISIVLYISHS